MEGSDQRMRGAIGGGEGSDQGWPSGKTDSGLCQADHILACCGPEPPDRRRGEWGPGCTSHGAAASEAAAVTSNVGPLRVRRAAVSDGRPR